MGNVIDISVAPAWVDGLLPEMKAAAARGCLAAAQRGVSEIVGRIIPSRSPQPIDRSIYRAGWKAEPAEGGADLYNAEAHAVLIEDGVRAANVKVGMLMLRALASWAERKGLARKGDGMSAAWGIATNLKKRGIFNGGQGLGILKELLEDRMSDFIEEEVARELERLNG